MVESCGNCKYYRPTLDDPGAPPDGECRYNPPMVGVYDEDPFMGIWPHIEPTAWCGKHEFIAQADPRGRTD